jgi:hypothetical protein
VQHDGSGWRCLVAAALAVMCAGSFAGRCHRRFAAAPFESSGPQADYRSTSKRMAAMSSLEGTASSREPFQHRNTWRKLGVISDDFDYQYSQVLND